MGVHASSHIGTAESLKHAADPLRALAELQARGAEFDTVRPGALPPKPDGAVRLVCVSDTHGLQPKQPVPEGDILLHAGDFTNVGRRECVEKTVAWLDSLPHAHKIVIPGNHDVTFHPDYYERTWQRWHRDGPQDAQAIVSMMKSACTLLVDESIEVHGIRFVGTPWQPEFYDWAFNLPRGEPCAAAWHKLPEADVLLSHGPPLGLGDLCRGGSRAGCVNLLHEVATRIKPAVHVFGHIHEGYGVYRSTICPGTVFVNASTCTHSYKPDNPAVVIDLMPPEPGHDEAPRQRPTVVGVYNARSGFAIKDRVSCDDYADEGKDEPAGTWDASLEALLAEAYGKAPAQLGHRTDGHQCITPKDREEALVTGSSLLYGEVLPDGVTKMMDADHLDAGHARVLYDLGMGTGKLALQAFLQYPNLQRVVGIELAFSRFTLGEGALLNLARKFPHDFVVEDWVEGESLNLVTTGDNRVLEFRRGNMLDVTARELTRADVVVIETDVPSDLCASLSRLLCVAKRGARLLTYLNLAKVWLGPIFPLEQFLVNRSPEDRFLTSWSPKRGHHFFIWLKITDPFDWNEAVLAATACRRPRRRSWGARRLAALLRAIRAALGRHARAQQHAQEQAQRRQELEHLTQLATSRALALQRAARQAVDGHTTQHASSGGGGQGGATATLQAQTRLQRHVTDSWEGEA